MSLLVWLPLTQDLRNQGTSDATFSIYGGSTSTTINTNGKLGKCYNNNSHSSGGLISNKTINLGQNQSMFCWFKFTDLEASSSLGGGLVSQHRYGSNSGMGITIKYVSSTTGYLSVNTGTGSSRTYNTYTGTTLLQANTWYHGGYTYDGSTLKIYVNGICEKIQAIAGMSVPADYITVFCWSLTTSGAGIHGDYKFNGNINDVRIYDHALSAKEVELLSRGLVCHYPLEGANNTLLPFGYQQLEYIESSGASAFDTKYKFNPEIDSLKMVFKGNDVSNNGMLFGQSSGTYFWLYYYGSNGIRVYASNGSSQEGIPGISSDLIKHTAEFKNKHYIIDGVDKGSLSNTYTEANYSSWMFSYGSTSYCFKGRIYYAQIGRNNVVQRTFIPAKRLSDSKIGMYELNTNEFFPSGTNTAFTAGDVVETPTTIYDCSGYQNNATPWAYDNTGSIDISSDTARYSTSTFINSANPSSNQAAGTRYIYGNCELTKPEKLTLAFWCKPITGYGGSTSHGIFSLTNYDIGANAGADYQSGPLNHRDAGFDINGITGTTYTHKRLSVGFTANQWHYYAITYDGRYGKLYKDAVQVSTIDMEATMPLGDMKGIVVGFSKAGGVWRHVQSYYSDVRLYTTALSAEQVAELYNTAATIDKNGTLLGYEFVEV